MRLSRERSSSGGGQTRSIDNDERPLISWVPSGRVEAAVDRRLPHRSGLAALSGSSAIAGFRPHRSHRAALPQWALQKGPEAGRSSGRLVHTREVRLQGLPALCPALRLPRRDPFLPLPFLHRLVSFGDFIDSMERSDSHPRCGELWSSLVRRPRRRPPADADGSHGSGMGHLAVTWSKPPAEHPVSRMTRPGVLLSLVRAPALPPRHADFGSQFHTPSNRCLRFGPRVAATPADSLPSRLLGFERTRLSLASSFQLSSRPRIRLF